MTTVAFLGTGSMNGAIASGLLAGGADPATLRATVGSVASVEPLKKKLGERGSEVLVLANETEPEANLRAVQGADLVLLGVKPYAILDLARQIAPVLDPSTLVVSVAAGITLDALTAALPEGQPVIRCMPNTPSRVGKGVLAISVGASVSASQQEVAANILAAAGQVFEVGEEQMGAVTAVSGSGPAYAFLLAETMAAAGVKLGLDEQTATALAAATVAGAGYLLEADPDPESLRQAVTSPKGTTDRAIRTFTEGGLFELTEAAMRACVQRNDEMTAEFCGGSKDH
ncbi:pyrroline-5-carboxylate reductase [Rothia sp. CCM 9417]|uniref:pyrroline-5-carboxylate reductase n=1 Tax=unclassified Rothia (in: high G+C Gram-positive bacteria) TaxID=2689056 RepID=UPI003ACD9D36